MASKRNKPKGMVPKTWDSTGNWSSPNGKLNPDTYCVIWESMLRSAAMARLTPRQQMLVVICRAQTTGKHRPRHDLTPQQREQIAENAGITTGELYHDRVFYLTWATVQQYHLYRGIKNRQVFHRDMQELHRAGFIEILRQGINKHVCAIYRLSDEWRDKTNRGG